MVNSQQGSDNQNPSPLVSSKNEPNVKTAIDEKLETLTERDEGYQVHHLEKIHHRVKSTIITD